MNPTEYRRGELYWASLDPSLGSEASKTRPVLIVSANTNNIGAATLTILPLSSSTHRLYDFEVYVEHERLSKPSKIQAQHIRTIDKRRVSDFIGLVSETDLELVEQAIKLHLALT